MKIVYDRNQKLTGKLTGDFSGDKEFIKTVLKNSGDMVMNPFHIGRSSKQAFVLYVDGMTDSQTVQDFAIRPLMEMERTQADIGLSGKISSPQ